jgi:hypothetical protein
MEGIS